MEIKWKVILMTLPVLLWFVMECGSTKKIAQLSRKRRRSNRCPPGAFYYDSVENKCCLCVGCPTDILDISSYIKRACKKYYKNVCVNADNPKWCRRFESSNCYDLNDPYLPYIKTDCYSPSFPPRFTTQNHPTITVPPKNPVGTPKRNTTIATGGTVVKTETTYNLSPQSPPQSPQLQISHLKIAVVAVGSVLLILAIFSFLIYRNKSWLHSCLQLFKSNNKENPQKPKEDTSSTRGTADGEIDTSDAQTAVPDIPTQSRDDEVREVTIERSYLEPSTDSKPDRSTPITHPGCEPNRPDYAAPDRRAAAQTGNSNGTGNSIVVGPVTGNVYINNGSGTQSCMQCPHAPTPSLPAVVHPATSPPPSSETQTPFHPGSFSQSELRHPGPSCPAKYRPSLEEADQQTKLLETFLTRNDYEQRRREQAANEARVASRTPFTRGPATGVNSSPDSSLCYNRSGMPVEHDSFDRRFESDETSAKSPLLSQQIDRLQSYQLPRNSHLNNARNSTGCRSSRSFPTAYEEHCSTPVQETTFDNPSDSDDDVNRTHNIHFTSGQT